MKLLCIEDNTALSHSLKGYLSKLWSVEMAKTGNDGYAKARTRKFDLIILDIGLPDISGITICRKLRSDNIDTPILVLSGTTDTKIKIELLKIGADDYLTKPFSLGELQARLDVLIRRGRTNKHSPYVLQVADLKLNPLTRIVEREGDKISLRKKEFDILEYLMRNKGKVVTRTMILGGAWEPDTDSWNNTVDVHIKYLRDKVDRPYNSKLIHTSYGVGYKISE